MNPEVVKHPNHYTSHPSGVECMDIVKHMNFCIGAAFKYLWRCDLKGTPIQDLKKAIENIEAEINRRIENDELTPEEREFYKGYTGTPGEWIPISESDLPIGR